MLSFFLNLAATTVFGLLLLRTGGRIRRALRFPLSPAERPAVDLSIGGAFTGTLMLIFGLMHLFRPSVLIGGLLLQSALVFLLPEAVKSRKRGARWSPLLLTSGIAALPNALIALGPPHFYDSMVYHLGLPWQALQEGAVSAHPEDLFSTFPPLTQLINAPLLAIHAWRAPAMIHLLAWIFAASAAGGMARRLGAGKTAAHLVTAATMLLPQTPLVPGFPAAEAWFLAALIPAVSMLLGPAASMSGRLNSRMAAAFLLAGIACAHRLQGLSWAVLLVLFTLIRSRRIRTLSTAAAWGFLGSSSWWLKNAILLHDPAAPVFWQRPGMESLWRDGGAWLKAGLTLHEMLARLPIALSPMAQALFPLLLAGTMAAAFHRRSRSLCILAAMSFFLWPLQGALPRFFAPVAILWLIVASTWRRPRIGRIAALFCLLPGLGLGLLSQLSWIRNTEALSLLHMNFRTAAPLVAPNPPFQAYDKLDDILPEDTRVLLVSESRGFGLPRPFLSPSQHDPSPLRPLMESDLPPDEISLKLWKRGLTHILINMGELQRLQNSYPVAPWASPAGEGRWWAFIQSLGSPLLIDGPIRVWALRPPDQGAAVSAEAPSPDPQGRD